MTEKPTSQFKKLIDFSDKTKPTFHKSDKSLSNTTKGKPSVKPFSDGKPFKKSKSSYLTPIKSEKKPVSNRAIMDTGSFSFVLEPFNTEKIKKCPICRKKLYKTFVHKLDGSIMQIFECHKKFLRKNCGGFRREIEFKNEAKINN